jgi:hypothetical protein
MNDIDMSDCSAAACMEYPEPIREIYFTDSDYDSACRRIAQKRRTFDKRTQFVKAKDIDDDSYVNTNKSYKDPFKTNPAKARVPPRARIYPARKNALAVKLLSIDGELFKTTIEVSRAYGMSVAEVSKRIGSKDYPTWKYHED